MKELIFNDDNELKETIKGKYIASGSEASVYKYKNSSAIRLYDVDNGIYSPITGELVGKALEGRLVENLQAYRDNIRLTNLPFGIVKINDIVVGQLIKYYKNSITLIDFFKGSPSIDPIPYYLKVLDILEELALNNICYEDVHGGNFLVVGDRLRLIDFSHSRVKVNQDFNRMYYPLFQNFNTMVNKLTFSVLGYDDAYNKLVIPEEIKNDKDNLKEDFYNVRKLVKGMVKEKNKSR